MNKDCFLKGIFISEKKIADEQRFCFCVFVLVFNDGKRWHNVKETQNNLPNVFDDMNFLDEPKVKFWD